MVKFVDNSTDPIILVPEELTLDEETNVCPNFLEQAPYIREWRRLCPYMVRDVSDEMFEFVLCLIGFLGKPSLCGLLGCDCPDITNQDSTQKMEIVDSVQQVDGGLAPLQ